MAKIIGATDIFWGHALFNDGREVTGDGTVEFAALLEVFKGGSNPVTAIQEGGPAYDHSDSEFCGGWANTDVRCSKDANLFLLDLVDRVKAEMIDEDEDEIITLETKFYGDVVFADTSKISGSGYTTFGDLLWYYKNGKNPVVGITDSDDELDYERIAETTGFVATWKNCGVTKPLFANALLAELERVGEVK